MPEVAERSGLKPTSRKSKHYQQENRFMSLGTQGHHVHRNHSRQPARLDWRLSLGKKRKKKKEGKRKEKEDRSPHPKGWVT